jgi:hypothetical protein
MLWQNASEFLDEAKKLARERERISLLVVLEISLGVARALGSQNAADQLAHLVRLLECEGQLENLIHWNLSSMRTMTLTEITSQSRLTEV